MVSCQKGPTRYAYAWQIEPFWQDTRDNWMEYKDTLNPQNSNYSSLQQLWLFGHIYRFISLCMTYGNGARRTPRNVSNLPSG